MADGLQFDNQRELFKLLDEMLDNRNFRMEWSEKVIQGARKLTNINNQNIEKLNNLITSNIW
jgi:hypothetical protein